MCPDVFKDKDEAVKNFNKTVDYYQHIYGNVRNWHDYSEDNWFRHELLYKLIKRPGDDGKENYIEVVLHEVDI